MTTHNMKSTMNDPIRFAVSQFTLSLVLRSQAMHVARTLRRRGRAERRGVGEVAHPDSIYASSGNWNCAWQTLQTTRPTPFSVARGESREILPAR